MSTQTFGRTEPCDYWELHYLKHLKRPQFKQLSWVFLGLSLVPALATAIAFKTTALTPWSFLVAAVLETVCALAGAAICFIQWANLGMIIEMDNREGRIARRPLAEQIRAFAKKQEDEFGFLLGKRPYDWHEWVLDHYREIRDKWPLDFEEFRVLRQNVDYERARKDVFASEGHGYGYGTIKFEEIWEQRKKVREIAQQSLKKDRAVTAIERDGMIEEKEKAREAQMNTLAGRARVQQTEAEND